MVVAKTDRAHRGLAAQFADHGRTGPLERGYLALVWGVPDRPRAPSTRRSAARPATARRSRSSASGGREAITHYRVAERYGAPAKPPVASLVECRLETGRTHQIRVHLAAIGHPGHRRPHLWRRLRHQGGAPAGAGAAPRRGVSPPGAARLAARLRAPGDAARKCASKAPLPADMVRALWRRSRPL